MTRPVLLTGFEPFGGHPTNPSADAVLAAVPLLAARGVPAVARVLPVRFGVAGDLLLEAVCELRPRLVIAVGLAAGRPAITPERIAVNVQDAAIPDDVGASPVDRPVVPGGPDGLFSTLPVKALVAAVADLGLPAAVSQTAGTYVCNDVFYRLQHHLGGGSDVGAGSGAGAESGVASDAGSGPVAGAGLRGGFVHVPAPDVVPVAAQAAALARMVVVALGTGADLHRAGGAVH